LILSHKKKKRKRRRGGEGGHGDRRPLVSPHGHRGRKRGEKKSAGPLFLSYVSDGDFSGWSWKSREKKRRRDVSGGGGGEEGRKGEKKEKEKKKKKKEKKKKEGPSVCPLLRDFCPHNGLQAGKKRKEHAWLSLAPPVSDSGKRGGRGEKRPRTNKIPVRFLRLGHRLRGGKKKKGKLCAYKLPRPRK